MRYVDLSSMMNKENSKFMNESLEFGVWRRPECQATRSECVYTTYLSTTSSADVMTSSNGLSVLRYKQAITWSCCNYIPIMALSLTSSKSTANEAASRVTGFLSVLMYMFCSVSMILTNKVLMHFSTFAIILPKHIFL